MEIEIIGFNKMEEKILIYFEILACSLFLLEVSIQ